MKNPVHIKESWSDTDNQDNSLATASRAAPAGNSRHYVTGISGGYSAANIGSMILKQDTTEIGRWYVHNSLAVEFTSPIEIAANTAVSVELEASGTGGQIGAVNIKGYSL